MEQIRAPPGESRATRTIVRCYDTKMTDTVKGKLHMQHSECDARSIGQAAYLYCLGIHLVGCFPGSNGRYVWRFDNTDDAAWRAGIAWRERQDALVNGPAFLESYRQMAAMRDLANGLEHGKKVGNDGQMEFGLAA